MGDLLQSYHRTDVLILRVGHRYAFLITRKMHIRQTIKNINAYARPRWYGTRQSLSSILRVSFLKCVLHVESYDRSERVASGVEWYSLLILLSKW